MPRMDGRPITAASTQHPLCPGTKAKGVSTGEHSKERPLHVPMGIILMLLIEFSPLLLLLLALVGNIYLSFDRYYAPGLDRLPPYEWRPTPSTPPVLPPHTPNVTKGRKYVMLSFIHDS